ncbi:MAG TPA: HAD-IC family P-type ATPase, partial [Candidatus Hydrogenedentes bacterium]|nr:HAD-IC family P-type ATPase [Candidatus Hydrogenedentota bacterium]
PFRRLETDEAGAPAHDAEAAGRDDTDASACVGTEEGGAISSEQAARAVGWAGLCCAVLALVLWLLVPALSEFWRSWGGPWAAFRLMDDAPAWTRGVYAALAALSVLSPFAVRTGFRAVMAQACETGRAWGMLFRDASATRTLGGVTLAVFDKTGTLTEGRPSVREVACTRGVTDRGILAWAAAVEAHAAHALARAVIERCQRDGISIEAAEDYEPVPGLGGAARKGEATVLVGRPRLLRERGVDLSEMEDVIAGHQSRGETVVVVAVNGRLVGALAMHDALRRDSVRATKLLRALGVRAALISGDNKATATVLAEQAGIEQVVADVLPGDRAYALDQLRSETIGKTLFVSASPEDRGLLAHADAGAALCPGKECGPPEASVTLTGGALIGVPYAVLLAREALSKAMINAVWIVAYHIVALALAVLGFIHPAVGVGISTLAWAITHWNARRLGRFDPEAFGREILERAARRGFTDGWTGACR